MLKTEEGKVLPFYCIGILCVSAIFGMPHNAGELAYLLNGGPNAWVTLELIIALGTYNLSQTIRPGGRTLREALFSNPTPFSTTRILGQAATLVSMLWGILVLASAGTIWYENSFSAMLDIWRVWPELLYSLSVAFASILFISAVGLFRSFMGAYFGFQILFYFAIGDVTIETFKPLMFLNDYPPHPFPLFNFSLTGAQKWPIYNLVMLMGSVALFAYSYKVWREKQWYLRKA